MARSRTAPNPLKLFWLRASPLSPLTQTAGQVGNVFAGEGEQSKTPGLALLHEYRATRKKLGEVRQTGSLPGIKKPKMFQAPP